MRIFWILFLWHASLWHVSNPFPIQPHKKSFFTLIVIHIVIHSYSLSFLLTLYHFTLFYMFFSFSFILHSKALPNLYQINSQGSLESYHITYIKLRGEPWVVNNYLLSSCIIYLILCIWSHLLYFVGSIRILPLICLLTTWAWGINVSCTICSWVLSLMSTLSYDMKTILHTNMYRLSSVISHEGLI